MTLQRPRIRRRKTPPGVGGPRRDMLVLRAAVQDARLEEDHQSRTANKAGLEVAKDYNAARKGKPHQPAAARPAGPLTLKDQVDLRWMLSQDCQQLIMQAVMLPTARSASAARHYLPRLSDAPQRLQPAVAVAELEEIAGQWQEPRSRYFDDQPAGFTLVEPLPRRRSTW